MPKPSTLLDEIELDALDDSVPLARALRKCIALGGRTSSSELRDWASQELNGYTCPVDQLPGYRNVVAPLVIDGFTFNARVQGEQISSFDLPEDVRDQVSEDLPLPQGVGQLEELVQDARRNDEIIRLAPRGAALIAKLMTAKLNDHYRAVERVYWKVSPVVVAGVLDQIRTKLVALVAEVRALDGGSSSPSTQAVDNAVSVVIHGNARNVHVTAAQGQGTAVTTNSPVVSSPWYRSAKVLWSFAVGVATIGGTIAIIWLHK